MLARRIDVLFYGLFMDADLLLEKGVEVVDPRRAAVLGHALRIGERATLVPDRSQRAYGVVIALTHAELDRLYSEESVLAYRSEAVICELEDGSRTAALCFNLVEPPDESARNPDYAAQLRDLAQRLGLPADYVASI